MPRCGRGRTGRRGSWAAGRGDVHGAALAEALEEHLLNGAWVKIVQPDPGQSGTMTPKLPGSNLACFGAIDRGHNQNAWARSCFTKADKDVETIFLNMHAAGVGLTLKKR